ncbi:hypothetical protein BDZ91DRAFT_120519 [Kalaharituber pfeilii]|nr:hypothetical protein BDZ91DRAFT_120519 [Kalaharituber pfeilii]
MESVTADTASPSAQSNQEVGTRPRGYRGRLTEHGRGGRGFGRGRGYGRDGGFGRARGGRGRSGAGMGIAEAQQRSIEHTPPDPLQQPVQSLIVSDSTKQADGQPEDGTEDTVCFICANPVIYYSITPCGHSTCHICSLRMRALYGNKACAHCRTETDYVVFAPDEDRKYEKFNDAYIVKTDASLGIKYATARIHDDTVLLLRYNCPESQCDIACRGWKDLHSHVKAAHNRVLCKLCTRNKKVFTHEHSLFTTQGLRKHEREGDDLPGAVDQSGFKGHPECGFCRERFYSSDELYNHCREAHERCFLCDRQNYSQNQQYYLNYDALVLHFQEMHYMCQEPECLEKKFVVFDSEVDLKAHQLEVHPHGLSKAAKRDARRIDISHFQNARAPQESRGRGRGRDPNADLPPLRTEQPLRRDELAFQRTLAVQSAQSTTTRTFGGQLTNPGGPAYTAQPAPVPAQRPVQVQTAPTLSVRSAVGPPGLSTSASQFPPLSATNAQNAGSPLPITRASTTGPAGMSAVPHFPPLGAPQPLAPSGAPAPGNAPYQSPASSQPSQPAVQQVDETKKARHAQVLERASSLLKNDSAKLDTFRRYVSEYKSGVKTARETCDAFWSLFNVSTNELGILIRALAELYENETKRLELLTAWNSWKAVPYQSEDYPPISGTGAADGTPRGSRVLKIKSSTTPSARSARQGAWGSAASPIASSSATSSTNRSVGGSTLSTSPWTSPAPQLSQPSRHIVTTAATSTSYASPLTISANASRAPSASEFPSLPPKQPMHNFGPVIRNGGRGTVVNAWTSGNQPNGSNTAEADVETEGTSSGKKRKGKQKQTLFHFG